MITCKESVRFSVLRFEMFSQWEKVAQVFKKYGLPVIFTCGTEGHVVGDPHTHGFAIDMRSKHIARIETKQVILEELRQVLGPVYTVLLENPGADNEHFHWQVKISLWRTML
jgi:hypothetical protein